jgi:hypothetical protein
MAWEYKTIEIDQRDFFIFEPVDSQLNELGKEGWKLIAAVFVPQKDSEQRVGIVTYTFEREITQP